MAEEKDVLEQIKGIGDTTKKAVKEAEERISKSLEEKSNSVKIDAVKEAQEIVDKVKTAIEEKYDAEITTLKDEAKKAKDELKKIKAEEGTAFGTHGYAVSMADAILKELKKPENREIVKGVKGNSAVKANFEITLPEMYTKSVHTMTRADVTGGTVMLSSVENGTVGIARRRPFLRNVLSVGPTKNKFVVWFEKTNVEGGAGMTAEGTPKSQVSFQWVEKTIEVKKVTAYIKVTSEALEDIDEAEADIRQELIEQIELKLDEQLLTGDGNTNNIKGLATWATPFSAGALAGSIATPNESDVIRTAAAVMINNNFEPTHVLISPLDSGKIQMEKDNEGRYLIVPFNSLDGSRMSGVQVIENPGVAQGTAYIFDRSKVKVRIRKDLSLKVGYDDDDFTNNRVTFLAELRAAEFVATNHANAVVSIDFDTAISALQNGSSS